MGQGHEESGWRVDDVENKVYTSEQFKEVHSRPLRGLAIDRTSPLAGAGRDLVTGECVYPDLSPTVQKRAET